MKRLRSLAVLLAAMLLCAGCGGVPQSALPGVDPSDCLTVYTSHPEEIYAPLIEEFEDRTGIWVQVVAGKSGELLARIDEESAQPQADVMFGGGGDSLEDHRERFSPYRSQECDAITNPAFCGTDHCWTGFSVLPLVFVYNPKLVSERDAPAGWRNLTDAKWTGRIAFASPAVSGSCYTALATVVQLYGEEFAAQFARNLAGRCTDGSGDIIPLVADGTYSVGITLESNVQKAIADGAEVAYLYPEDGTSAVADGVAILKDAPHRENAEKFVDFMLGRDAQSFLCETIKRRPVREDITIQGESKLENLNLIDYDLARAAREKEDLVALWQREYELGEVAAHEAAQTPLV